MTAAQKIAKEKFKKAIAIRKKTGVSLKEAFAEVYGKKKVGAVKKKAAKKVVKKAAPKKAAKKVVKKAAPKKAAKKVVQKTKPRYSAEKHTNWATIPAHKRRVNGLPKKKKVSEQSILNKIHKVKDQVNSLDELQHKHMISGYTKQSALINIEHNLDIVKKLQNRLEELKEYKKQIKAPGAKRVLTYNIKKLAEQIKEHKTHIAQLKKHI
jgi:hypothetical protein